MELANGGTRGKASCIMEWRKVEKLAAAGSCFEHVAAYMRIDDTRYWLAGCACLLLPLPRVHTYPWYLSWVPHYTLRAMAIITDDSPPPYTVLRPTPVGVGITYAIAPRDDAPTTRTDVVVSVIPPTSSSPAAMEAKGEKEKEKERVCPARAPVDICLVIDVSGSMSTSAPVSATSGAGVRVLLRCLS